MYTLITLIGIVVTAFFIIGFGLGLKNAVAEYRSGVPESDEMPDYSYGGLAAFSVIASAVVIAGAGFSPAMIYAGPLLALVTAAGCGLAFFVEDKAIG